MCEVYHRYVYEGPVYEFNKCVVDRWKAETVAPSTQKAKSNIMYQYKKQTNRIAGIRVILPGTIKMVN